MSQTRFRQPATRDPLLAGCTTDYTDARRTAFQNSHHREHRAHGEQKPRTLPRAARRHQRSAVRAVFASCSPMRARYSLIRMIEAGAWRRLQNPRNAMIARSCRSRWAGAKPSAVKAICQFGNETIWSSPLCPPWSAFIPRPFFFRVQSFGFSTSASGFSAFSLQFFSRSCPVGWTRSVGKRVALFAGGFQARKPQLAKFRRSSSMVCASQPPPQPSVGNSN